MSGNISNIHSDTCRSIEYARKYLTKLTECCLWKETSRCVTNWINHIRCCALCASWIFVGATHTFRTCQSALFRRMPEDAFPEIQYECNALLGHWLFELQSTQIKYSRDWTSQYHSDGRPHYTKPMARINFNDISFLCDMYSGILYMAFSCNVPIKIAIEHVTGPLEIETSTYCTIPIIFRPVLGGGFGALIFRLSSISSAVSCITAIAWPRNVRDGGDFANRNDEHSTGPMATDTMRPPWISSSGRM